MYFTSGQDRAFERLMQEKPGFDHYDGGGANAPEDCGTCRFYRPDWKYQYCVYAECPYQPGKLTALAAVKFTVKGADDDMAVFRVEKNKCKARAVNTNCPVCKNNMSECTGPEPQETQPQETEAPQEELKNSGSGAGGLIVFLVVALAGGGAALYYFKFKKPRADTKGSDDLDEYDFGDDEDLEDEAPETEDAPQNE